MRRKNFVLGFIFVLYLEFTILVSPPCFAEQTRIPKEPYSSGQVLLEADKNNPNAVKVLISRFHVPNENYIAIIPTIEALEKTFGKGNLQVKVFRGGVVEPNDADIMITSSGVYRRFNHIGTRDLASLVSDSFPDPNKAEGSVFLVRKDSGINKISDLEGKRLAATSPNSFTGYLVGANEVVKAGYDPEKFFSKRIWTHDMLGAVKAVKNRKADVAIVRTCFLEESKANESDFKELRVLQEKENSNGFRCKRSTELFPSWTVFVTPRADKEVARKTASALLSMPLLENNAHWTIATDFTKVDRLFFNLKEGPYLYLKEWSLKNILKKYWSIFTLFFGLVVALYLHSWRSNRLVEIRTYELAQARAQEMQAVEKVAQLQKLGALSHLSTMVAHEVRQPLSALMSYAYTLQRLLDSGKAIDNEVTAVALNEISAEAHKIEEIIQRVRAYAKAQRTNEGRKIIDIATLVSPVIEELKKTNQYKSEIKFEAQTNCMATVDGFEIQLVLLNLIKNALQACQKMENGVITVSMSTDNKKIHCSVADNGPKISDEALENIQNPLVTSKADGLGLGITISKLIVESHGGGFTIRRNEPSGLIFSFSLPKANKQL